MHSWIRRQRSCALRTRHCCAVRRRPSTAQWPARRWVQQTGAVGDCPPRRRRRAAGPSCASCTPPLPSFCPPSATPREQYAALEARTQELQSELTAAYKEKASLAEASLQATRQLQVPGRGRALGRMPGLEWQGAGALGIRQAGSSIRGQAERGSCHCNSSHKVVRDINERQSKELSDAAEEAKRLRDQVRLGGARAACGSCGSNALEPGTACRRAQQALLGRLVWLLHDSLCHCCCILPPPCCPSATRAAQAGRSLQRGARHCVQGNGGGWGQGEAERLPCVEGMRCLVGLTKTGRPSQRCARRRLPTDGGG